MFAKIVSFVVIDKKDEETVTEKFNQAIDGLVIHRIPVFDSGIESSVVEHVENAEELRQEVLRRSLDE